MAPAFGGALGVLGANLFFRVFDFSGFLPVPVFYIPLYTMFFGVLLGSAIGVASGAIPAWRAASISVVDGLRRVG